jgi:VWFA-related protein
MEKPAPGREGGCMTRAIHTFILAAAVGVVLAGAPQQSTFRSGTNTVSIYATVTDAEGRLVTDLSADDFEVYDDRRRQELTVFANDRQPLSMVVMLDRSGSMSSRFELVRDAAEEFVVNLLPEDRVRIGSFSNRIQIDPESFTSDKAEMRRILREELQGAGPTPLWNATDAAMQALVDEEGRRVVLMFTDGKDTPEFGPNVRFEDLRARVRADETMIYGIGLSTSRCVTPQMPDPMGGIRFQRWPSRPGPSGQGGPFGRPPRFPGTPPIRGLPPVVVPPPNPSPRTSSTRCSEADPDPELRELVEIGGGGYFELRSTDNLRETFSRVAAELHHQYLLAFTAEELDNRLHELEVRVLQPDMLVRARRSYFAASSP